MNERDKIVIMAAAAGDISAITALLRAADLPSEDFAPHIERFLVAKNAGEIVGAVGAEVCGADALLRSLVVAVGQRGSGIGGRLLSELDQRANAWGVHQWWLLTTTAEEFFGQRGFRVSPRSEAPAEIRSTGQFSGSCCATAVCLTRAVLGVGL